MVDVVGSSALLLLPSLLLLLLLHCGSNTEVRLIAESMRVVKRHSCAVVRMQE